MRPSIQVESDLAPFSAEFAAPDRDFAEMKHSKCRLSVAVCTYNRSASLRLTLESIEKAMPPPQAWELLVIDNNSSDDTRQIVQSFEQRLPIRYLFEPTQGLSAARNRALQEFEGDWLIFTDDDVTVDWAWLDAYADAIATFPEAGFLGGRVVPAWPSQRPAWLGDAPIALLDGLLVWFDRGTDTRTFAAQEPLPYGASFALSRDAMRTNGEFRLDLGVKGSVVGRGEESEYMERIRSCGGLGVYVGKAVANHMTDMKRLRLGYLYRYGIQKGIAERRFGSEQTGSTLRAWIYILRGIAQWVQGHGDRFRQCIINAGIERGLMRDG